MKIEIKLKDPNSCRTVASHEECPYLGFNIGMYCKKYKKHLRIIPLGNDWKTIRLKKCIKENGK